MKSKRQILVNVLIVIGAFTTMATSRRDADLREQTQFTVVEATPMHITLRIDAEVVADADTIELMTIAPIEGDERYSVRIAPDNSAIPITEFDTDTALSHVSRDLQQYCQPDGPCSLGFTIDVISGDTPNSLEFFATATKHDPGGMCNSIPDDFSENASMTITQD